jgi:succinate dehydrogenase / fumarate reductase flavoprotein subunit
MPFDRNEDGTIYQRPFGGHSANYGEKAVPRACAAADRTGHALLHTLYQSNVKMGTQFFVEWIALDLIRNEAGDVLGVTAIDQETGNIAVFQAKQHCLLQVVLVVFTVHQPMLISILVTVLVWLLVQVFHYKIWNSGNSTQRVLRAQAYC